MHVRSVKGTTAVPANLLLTLIAAIILPVPRSDEEPFDSSRCGFENVPGIEGVYQSEEAERTAVVFSLALHGVTIVASV